MQQLQNPLLDGAERGIAGQRLVDLAQAEATIDPDALIVAHVSFAQTLFEIDECAGAIEHYIAALSFLEREHSKGPEALIQNCGFARIELLFQLSECYDRFDLMAEAFQTWNEIAISLPTVVKDISGCGKRVSEPAEQRIFAVASIAEHVSRMVVRSSKDDLLQQRGVTLSLLREAVIQGFFGPATPTETSSGELLTQMPKARPTPALAPVLGVLANIENQSGDLKTIDSLLSARWDLYAKYALGVRAEKIWSVEHSSNYLLPEAFVAGLDLASQCFGNGRILNAQQCLLSLFNFAQYGTSDTRASLISLSIAFIAYADFDDVVPIVNSLRDRKDLFYSESQRLRFLAEAGNKHRRANDRDGASSFFQEGELLIAETLESLDSSALASFYFYRVEYTLFSKGPPTARLLSKNAVRADLRRVVELTSDNSVEFNGRLYFLIRSRLISAGALMANGENEKATRLLIEKAWPELKARPPDDGIEYTGLAFALAQEFVQLDRPDLAFQVGVRCVRVLSRASTIAQKEYLKLGLVVAEAGIDLVESSFVSEGKDGVLNLVVDACESVLGSLRENRQLSNHELKDKIYLLRAQRAVFELGAERSRKSMRQLKMRLELTKEELRSRKRG